MNTNETMSHVEINKAVIQRYFKAYNNRNVAIFDEIIDPNLPNLLTRANQLILAPQEWELRAPSMNLKIH